MLRLFSSNNISAGDALGGFISRQAFPTFVPQILQDQCHCLAVEDIQVAAGAEVDKAEVTIVKTGDDFQFTLSTPTLAGGWIDTDIGTYTVTVGSTKTIEKDLFYLKLRRIRTGSDGTIIARLCPVHNNPLGGTDCDVADVTNTRYCCMFAHLDTDTYIEQVYSYSIIEGVQVAAGCQFEILAATNETQRIADYETAPTGITWGNSTTLSSLIPAGNYPIWVKTVSSGAVGIVTNVIVIDQGAGGDQNVLAVAARHRRYDEGIDAYRIYGDYAGATVYGTLIDSAASLPATVALAPPPSGTRDYKLRVVAVNKYGIESQNVALNHNVTIDDQGDDQTTPQTPSSVSVTFVEAGYAKLNFTYAAEIADPVIYAVCTLNGEDLTLEINGFNAYSVRTAEPCTWGATVSGTVYFIDSRGRTSATASASATCAFDYDDRPREVAGRVGGFAVSQCYPREYFELIDGLAACITELGGMTFYYDDVKQFETIVIDGTMYLDLTGWTVQNEVVSGAQVSSFEDAGAGVVYFAQGGTRRLKIDTVNKTFGANTFAQPITACRRVDNDVTVNTVTYYQAFPTFESGPEPWLAINGDTVYTCDIYQLTGT